MKAKRFAAAVLALVMALSLTTMAFATEPTTKEETLTNPGNKEIAVEGLYEGSGIAANVYSVKIEWGAMLFTYKTSGNKTWDPESHTYDVDQSADHWEAVGNTVTVTNHSNVPVNVAFSFTKAAGMGAYQGTMDVTEKKLAAGVENEPENADKVTSKLTLGGTLNRTVTTKSTLGTITVALSAVTVEP